MEDPEVCTKATMIVLAHIYKNELPALKKQMQDLNVSKQDALLYCWSNHKCEITNRTATPSKNTYVRNVHCYMQEFELHQHQHCDSQHLQECMQKDNPILP